MWLKSVSSHCREKPQKRLRRMKQRETGFGTGAYCNLGTGCDKRING